MGSGLSAQSLTDEQKIKISRTMQEKYKQITEGDSSAIDAKVASSNNNSNQEHRKETIPEKDIELFKTLMNVYDDTVSHMGSEQNNLVVRTPSEILRNRGNSLTGEEDDEDVKSIKEEDYVTLNKQGSSAVSTALTPKRQRQSFRDLTRRPSFDIDTEFDHENPVIQSKTSSELLLEAEQEALTNNEKIKSFINSLKEGDIVTKPASEFRIRRLTYAQKTVHSPDPVPIVAPKMSRKRTTIFASSEIGVVQEKKPPFPPEQFGTYSCHGIEPDPESETGIHEKINQDRGCVVHPFSGRPNASLFLVLDGHGEQGDKVSEFVMRQLVVTLEKHPEILTDPESALKDSFVKTNTALMVTPIQYMTSGCTCVALYMEGNHIYIANAGDSRAVLATRSHDQYDEEGNRKIIAKNLSKDHKPDDPEEMKRITEWGGFVCPAPEPGISARVYLDDKFTMIGLAMSRSIGDYSVKRVGVIPEPEVTEHNISPDDQFIIMASDGVWEFISSQEAVDIVVDSLEYGALVACQELIETAAYRWQEIEGDYRDDITAIIVRLPLPHRGSGADSPTNK